MSQLSAGLSYAQSFETARKMEELIHAAALDDAYLNICNTLEIGRCVTIYTDEVIETNQGFFPTSQTTQQVKRYEKTVDDLTKLFPSSEEAQAFVRDAYLIRR